MKKVICRAKVVSRQPHTNTSYESGREALSRRNLRAKRSESGSSFSNMCNFAVLKAKKGELGNLMFRRCNILADPSTTPRFLMSPSDDIWMSHMTKQPQL